MNGSIPSKRCFVVMSFGKRTDLATGRQLDFDVSYNVLIKPVVEEKGLACVRVDEISHSGVIDLAILRELLMADVVIADLSTENPNVLYELGIRHALRPHTTVVISEAGPPYPFDVNHVNIHRYTHLGNDIGWKEVMRFKQVISETLDAALAEPKLDSPVYTFLQQLQPPTLPISAASLPNLGIDRTATLAALIERGEAALKNDRFAEARDRFAEALKLYGGEATDRRVTHDPYLVQRFVLAIYKARQPTELMALYEAQSQLGVLKPFNSNDPVTVGLAGDIEKGLFHKDQGHEHLDYAIALYGRRLQLRRAPHDGLTLATALTVRASVLQESAPETARADLVRANNIRNDVLEISERALAAIRKQQRQARGVTGVPQAQLAQDRDHEFRCLAAMAEASFGLGDIKKYEGLRSKAKRLHPPSSMLAALEETIAGLRELLERTRSLFTRQGSKASPGPAIGEEKA